MHLLHRYAAILPVMAALSFLAVSCSNNSKVAECNNILQIGNKTSPTPEKADKNPNNIDPKQLLSQAEQAGQKAKEMEALTVKDEKLLGFKSRFVKVYKDENQALRNTAKAVTEAEKVASKTEPVVFKASLKVTDMYLKAAEVYNRQLSLINDFTTYCSN